jgi:hypothetical protein
MTMNISAIFVLFALLMAAASPWSPAQEKKLLLVIDSKVGTDINLHHFRRVQDPFPPSTVHAPSREGLEDMKVSGSSEYSREGLARIRKNIACPVLVIVDLREESHGTVNGIPMSWNALPNWANRGKNLAAIEADEQIRLEALLAKKSITAVRFYPGEQPRRQMEVDVTATEVSTEKALCRAAGISYLRIPVSEDCRPTDAAVDILVTHYREQREKTWFHFHCFDGHGRTTTFMVLCDMLDNAKKVSFKDILARQYLIGGTDLSLVDMPESWKHACYKDRLDFLTNFYDYCRAEKDGYRMGWLAWRAGSEKMSP